MKRTIFCTLLIWAILSSNSFAYGLTNNLEISGGIFSQTNGEEVRMTTFKYIDSGDNLFLPSELSFDLGEETNGDSNSIELSFFHELDGDLPLVQMGVGYKYLNKDNSRAEKSGWAIPLTLKAEKDILPRTTFQAKGQLLPFGNYSVISKEDLAFGGSLTGYEIDLALNHQLSDTFSLKLGYSHQSYSFGDDLDNSQQPIAGYNQSLSGIYFGGRISF